ncbi:NADPH-dependent glutamate synthase [Candidatus Bathyarchaeota archaeon]|nr:NADPH-dependent glutamate synthase [Candidatus Bathyarchaeota archaeon]
MPSKHPSRQEMPCQDPGERIGNFNEVALGFSENHARLEASRCLNCKNTPCIDGCPVGIDIRAFLTFVVEGEFKRALEIIKEKNTLPAITGRVCPQEMQCEAVCTLGKVKNGTPLAIGSVERFIADWNAMHDTGVVIETPPRTGIEIAVIGSGPAGLTAAGELARLGHEVTVFEAFHRAGGVLVYGIPEFRLPKDVLEREIEFLENLGVRIELDTVVGKTVEIQELLDDGFKAVFIGTGAGLPRFLGIPGEGLVGVYSANEFLTRTNLMKAYNFPEYDTPISVGRHVSVIGGGNVAMDSARTALRLGADTVTVFYRRTVKEMPARSAEIDHAIEEGIQFRFLRNPVALIGNEENRLVSMKLQEMTLGCLDASGRASCEPVEGKFEKVDTDMVIIAIGSDVNTICTSSTCNIETGRRGRIVAMDASQRTTMEGVFAAGDAVTGGATVISAMGDAKKAAKEIHEYITSGTSSNETSS